MALDPRTLSFDKARPYLPQPTALASNGRLIADFEAEVLDLMEAGDFWQNARRYVGPLPAPGDTAGMALLRKSFAPILRLREVLRRHKNGVIGKEPLFEVVLDGLSEPRRKRQKRENYEGTRSDLEAFADDVDSVQGDVWDEEGEHKIIKAMVARLLATGSAYLRFDVPPDYVEEFVDFETNEVSMGVAAEDVPDWQTAYGLTYLELAPRGTAAVYRDPLSRRKTAFYSYREPVPSATEANKTRAAIQISWVDAKSGLTQMRVVREGTAEVDEWEVDTGGVLPIIEAVTEPLLSPDLLRLQDIICAIATNIKINSDVAGHPQMTLLDIEAPATEEPAATEDDPNATKTVPAPLETGPRTVQVLYSYVAEDANGKPILGTDGKPVIKQGSISYREPVNSAPLREDIALFSEEIYSATNQRHIPARVSANASGEMLLQMRSDYADSLLETKPDVERALRNMFKGRLCMAASLAKDKATLARFKSGRVRVDLLLNAGPLSHAERDELLKQYEKKLKSRQSVMVLLGTDDPDAELAQLKEEQGEGVAVPAAAPAAPAPTSEETEQ